MLNNINWQKRAAAGLLVGIFAARILTTRWCQRGFRRQIAVVTGGSRGLGFIIARKLAEQGCKVAICARDAAEVDRAVNTLKRGGHDVYGRVCDVSSREDTERFLADVERDCGTIDILVNNAGVIEVGPISSMTHEDFRSCMDIMCFGILNMTLPLIPKMRERHKGQIINITSIGGVVSVPHLLPYSTAKFAAVGLSEGLTAELAKDGIKVTTVVPGLMRTGSYLRAIFKGEQDKEALWFSLSDNIPGLSISGEAADDQILDAIRSGKPRLTISIPAKALSLFHGVFPSAAISVLKVVNRFILPGNRKGVDRGMDGLEVSERYEGKMLGLVMDSGRSDAEAYLQIAE